jgi:hypothetical protein
MADVPAWNAKGEWFDVCRCNVPCPCSWAQPPDVNGGEKMHRRGGAKMHQVA